MADEVTFEVLPGQLQATVRLHDVDVDGSGTALRCWTAVSDGLASVGPRTTSDVLRGLRDGSPVRISDRDSSRAVIIGPPN